MFTGRKSKIIGNILPITGEKDDIFIVCSSFEERTIAVSERLDPKYLMENCFIFKYDEKTKTILRDLNFKKLTESLAHNSENIFPIICDRFDPLDGIQKIQEVCQNNRITISEKNISIDVTTFTKQCLLVLLRFLASHNPKSVRLFYTEPVNYAPEFGRPLSYGLIDIVSVPSYGGHFYIEKEVLLIIMLGYEGDRAYSIWQALSPHKTIVLIGKSSSSNEYEERVRNFNRKLIDRLPKKSIEIIDSMDPFQVSEELKKRIQQHSSQFNIMISPLGPKPQVVGCFLALEEHHDVQIIYAIPKRYEEQYFSKKIGEIWEYR